MTTEADSITEVTQITDHRTRAAALFYRQFRNSTQFKAFADAWMVQVQEIEDALWALLVDTLETAVGAQLDQIGAILLFSRGLLNDATYRRALRAMILARKSNGTPEDLIGVARAFLDTITFSYTQGSASVVIEPHAKIPFEPTALLALLKLAASGGIQLDLISPPDAESLLFTFAASDLLLVTGDTSKGFSNVAQDTGGRLTGALT